MTNVFDAQVRAVDAASGPISRMVQGMRSIITAAKNVSVASEHAAHGAQAAATASAHAIQAVSHEAEASHVRYFRSVSTHIHLLKGHFGELNAGIGETRKSLTEFFPLLAGLGAGASLVGLLELTRSTAEASIAGEALMTKLGTTGKEFAGLKWGAKESGVEVDALVGGMEKLNKTLGMIGVGKGKEAAALFKHLGFTAAQMKDFAHDPALAIPKLADAFARTKDPAMRALMATTLFGKQGQELLPMLMKGSEALDEFAEKAKKFGYFATPEQKAALKDFGHANEELEASVSGFKKQIASSVAPVLLPVVEAVRDWVQANRGWIATGIANKVKALGEVIKSVLKAVSDIHDGTKTWGDVLRDVAGEHTTLIALAGGLSLALGSPIILAVKAVVSAFGALIGVLRTVTMLLWANPWMIAIGLIAGAAYLIWENWEPLKAFFIDLWARITVIFEAAWAKIKPIVDDMKAAMKWVEEGYRAVASTIGGGAARAVQSVGNALTGPAGTPEFGGFAMPGGFQMPTLTAPAAQTGQVNVRVDFANAPPGTQVQTGATGIAQPPDTFVGYSNPIFAY